MQNEIEFVCKLCNKKFKRKIFKSTRTPTNQFCSHQCFYKYRNNKIIISCAFCNSEIIKKQNELKKSKSGNMFCNHSCAAKYNNAHKTTGNRRSKLEIYLEEQIELNYSELKCIYNTKEIINSELDFYFPSLKFAIELNGIFHYEPIYGNDKLEKIQFNDSQKILLCKEKDIELCIIDSSSCVHLNQKQKDKYWSIVKHIIDKIYQRHIIK